MRRDRRTGGLLSDAFDVHQRLQPDLRMRRAHVPQHLRSPLARSVTADRGPMPERGRPGGSCGELRSGRRGHHVPDGPLLPIHRSTVLRRSVRPRRVHPTTDDLHEGVGTGVRLRRAQLQQRLCCAFPWRVDPPPRLVPGRCAGGRRSGRSEVRGRGRSPLRHRPVLSVHARFPMRGDEQAWQVSIPSSGVHRGLQPGLWLRRQDLRERMLRKRCRRISSEKGTLLGAVGAAGEEPLPAIGSLAF